tara:strand:+ start:428 stop:559 length:132 start_codon:yes stop_codon:yes gene_type:complete
MPTNFNKKRICHKCGESATYFYKQWWCGHTRELQGFCKNERKK